jgi:hypothetical protein
VGHSESWRKGFSRDSSWLGAGGVLEGKSWRRIGFLRRIMEEGPADGIGPVGEMDYRIGGLAGRYYIVYFGRQRPRRWQVRLPRGIPDGAHCKADLIDTWNMKITPVKGLIRLRSRGKHEVAGVGGESIRLPGRPYMAVRIRIMNNEQQEALS